MLQEDEMEQCGGSSAIQKIRCEFEANLDHTVRETGVSQDSKNVSLKNYKLHHHETTFIPSWFFSSSLNLPCLALPSFSLVCVHVYAYMFEDVHM